MVLRKPHAVHTVKNRNDRRRTVSFIHHPSILSVMSLTDQNSVSSPKKSFIRIAVTGGAASGKTTVCNRLAGRGVALVSSDVLARKAVEPGTRAYEGIVSAFGEAVMAPDGRLNRSRLRHMIVHDDTARRELERWVHPEVIGLIDEFMTASAAAGDRCAAAEVPLLFELSLQARFDVVLLVVAERELQIVRLMRRDKVTRSDAEALLNAQMSDDAKRKGADVVIVNRGASGALSEQVDAFYEKYCQKP